VVIIILALIGGAVYFLVFRRRTDDDDDESLLERNDSDESHNTVSVDSEIDPLDDNTEETVPAPQPVQAPAVVKQDQVEKRKGGRMFNKLDPDGL
jgi:hypothetical protein